jgi:UDP-glucose 4-epimerase
MRRRALVTGGAGFIGSHVADLLLEHDYEVDVLDNLSSGKGENVPAGATLHEMDIAHADAARLVREGGFDVVCHLAAQIDVRKSVADPMHDAAVNILGTINLLEGTRTAKRSPRFIFSSTGGAIYGDYTAPPNPEDRPKEPEAPYGIGKLAGEHYLSFYARLHGVDTVALRYANVYGPRQDPHGEAGVVAIFCGRALGGRPATVFGDGRQTRDYVYVGDVARANLLAAAARLAAPSRLDARAFNIGTGVPTSVLELARALGDAAGRPLPVEFAPPRPGEQMASVVTNDKAREGLGWRPEVQLRDGLRRTFEWFAERHARAAR